MAIYGYARVYTAGQSLNEQKETLKISGADMCSGANKMDYFFYLDGSAF